jgi:hypothetical protein
VIGDRLTNIETGMTIPEWHVVPSEDGKDWSYKSDPYPFHDNPAFVEVIPNESMKVTDTGMIDMEGHTYNSATGEIKQKVLPYEGKETAEPLLSMSQQLEILRQETQKIKDTNGGVLPDSYRYESAGRAYNLLGKLNRIDYEEMRFSIDYPETFGAFSKWWDSRIFVRNETTGKYDQEPTLFYTWTAIGDGGKYGYLVIEDVDGNMQAFFIDKEKLNDFEFNATRNFTPFRID